MSTVNSEKMDSPKSRKGFVGRKKKDMKLHTMKIEQFLSHINVNREEDRSSPAVFTDMSVKRITETSAKKSLELNRTRDDGSLTDTQKRNKS